MTFRTKLIAHASALAALVVLFVLGTALSPQRTMIRDARRQLFPGIASHGVGSMELRTDSGRKELYTVPGPSSPQRWMYRSETGEFPASGTRIEAFIGLLESIETSRLVSGDDTRAGEFGLETGHTETLTIFDRTGAERWKLFVGKPGAEGSSVYVRSALDPRVYETRSDLLAYMEKDDSFWLELGLFPDELSESDVTGISVKAEFSPERKPGTLELQDEYELVRAAEQGGEIWKLVGRELSLDQNEVRDLVRSIISLEASGMTGESADGTDRPQAEILVSTASSDRYRLLVGEAASEDLYYVTMEGSRYRYTVGTWRLERVLRPLSALLSPSLQ